MVANTSCYGHFQARNQLGYTDYTVWLLRHR